HGLARPVGLEHPIAERLDDGLTIPSYRRLGSAKHGDGAPVAQLVLDDVTRKNRGRDGEPHDEIGAIPANDLHAFGEALLVLAEAIDELLPAKPTVEAHLGSTDADEWRWHAPVVEGARPGAVAGEPIAAPSVGVAPDLAVEIEFESK